MNRQEIQDVLIGAQHRMIEHLQEENLKLMKAFYTACKLGRFTTVQIENIDLITGKRFAVDMESDDKCTRFTLRSSE